MRTILYAVVAALVLILAAPLFDVKAEEFINGFDAIPLMEGMHQEPEPFVFDTEEIKIVEQFVAADDGADVELRDFREFYKDTLSSLGWELEADSGDEIRFERDNEELSIDVIKLDPLTATFRLAPEAN